MIVCQVFHLNVTMIVACTQSYSQGLPLPTPGKRSGSAVRRASLTSFNDSLSLDYSTRILGQFPENQFNYTSGLFFGFDKAITDLDMA